MDGKPFDYWIAPGTYMPLPTEPSAFDVLDVSDVPSLSGSPVNSLYSQFSTPMCQPSYYPNMVTEPMDMSSYAMAVTPSESGSEHSSPLSPTHADPMYASMPKAMPAERTHTTSGRRRAQNRAAQRAFRERKEKHTRELEAQLSLMTDKYTKLEASHTELHSSYEKLRQSMELLTKDGAANGNGISGAMSRRSNSDADTLRKLLEVMHGDFSKGHSLVKTESDLC